MESWRHFFYYLFGLLPSLFFSLRFLLQWIQSERRKKSVVSKAFWYLSILGNFLLALHYFIQLQYLFFLLQAINGFISWRNLNLLSTKKVSFRSSKIILLSVVLGASLLFLAQSVLFALPVKIFDIPAAMRGTKEISLVWHLFGSMGTLLFTSRFWMQWLEAERSQKTELGRNFWLASIIGSLAALIYFIHIQDWVSSLNYSMGLIPYIRNFILLKNARPS